MRYLLLSALLSLSAPAFAQEHAVQEEQVPAQVYTYVEQMPEFPGRQLMQYVNEHMKYPETEKKMGLEGKCAVRFVVNEDGSLSNFEVIKSLGVGFDEASLKLMRNMPKWIPGRQNGKTVKVYMTVPILYRLNNTK